MTKLLPSFLYFFFQLIILAKNHHHIAPEIVLKQLQTPVSHWKKKIKLVLISSAFINWNMPQPNFCH
jgi:hypothetical protein